MCKGVKTDRPKHESIQNSCNNVLLQKTRSNLKTSCINSNCTDTSRINSNNAKNKALLPFKIIDSM